MKPSPAPRSRSQRARTLAYWLAQHPLRGHAALVRRGLATHWLAEFAAFADEPGLPVDNFAGFQAQRYHYAREYRAATARGLDDASRYNTASARAMLYSFLWRRELHPLRFLPWAWALRNCTSILEYGAGAAPFAHGMTRAWPFTLPDIAVSDLAWVLHDYCRWRFARENDVYVIPAGEEVVWSAHDGVVCTETFEHLPEPTRTAFAMMRHANVIVFDYVQHGGEPAGRAQRATVLQSFRSRGHLTGPDARGTYVWRRA